MKKRAGVLALFLALLALLLCSCGRGKADNVRLVMGESSLYGEREIEAAMEVVCRFFEREFDGCELTELAYDEKLTLRDSQNGAEEVITLLASFETGPSGGDGSLSPNNTYTRYQWTLAHTALGGWELKDWGYG